MKRRIFTCALITVFVIVTAVRLDRSAASDGPALAGLSDAFSLTRGVVRDTNGDGLGDEVVARIIVPAKPALEDVLAAADIAARLGYETLAMNLPLVAREDEVVRPQEIGLPILVGRENSAIKKLADQGLIDIKSLSPGQGLVAQVPSPLGGPDGLAVAGAVCRVPVCRVPGPGRWWPGCWCALSR